MVKQIFFSNVWYVKQKHKREKGENFVPKFGLNSFVHIKRVIMKIIYCVAMWEYIFSLNQPTNNLYFFSLTLIVFYK